MKKSERKVAEELIIDYLADVFDVNDLESFSRACKMLGTSQEVNLSDLDSVFKIEWHMKKYHGYSLFYNPKSRKCLQIALQKHGIDYAEVV